MDDIFLQNIDAILDETRKHLSAEIQHSVSYCRADPSTKTLIRASNAIDSVYVELNTLRRVVLETQESLYGKWGDEEPDSLLIELWKREYGKEPARIPESIQKRLERIKRMMALVSNISSAINSAIEVPDLLINRSERKRYLEQETVQRAFDDIQKY